MASPSHERGQAREWDAADPLAAFRGRFVSDQESLIYLDGNSLGMLPRATAERITKVVQQGWGRGLIRSWNHWLTLPQRAGDLLGYHLLGAAPGQVIVCDNTTVNLYKLARAALAARPGRSVIVTDDDNFPTDRYVLAGTAAERGAEVRLLHTGIDQGVSTAAVAAAVDSGTALVCLSHVAYRSGALADMAEITKLAHDCGALVLWDLCHSAGAVPVALDACGADLAVGCTYKYLNAGPGAPAFLYVRRDLQERLRQPVQGWFGQSNQFEMGPSYDPVPGIGRFATGTPSIVGTAAVEEGVSLLAEAGIERLRAKGMRLTSYLVDLADNWLAPLGFTLATPRDPTRRGSHICLHHPDAASFSEALTAAGVAGDFRVPDRIRLGAAPITTRFTDIWDAMDTLRRIAAGKPVTRPARQPGWRGRLDRRAAPSDGAAAAPDATRCSFCARPRQQTRHLVAGPQIWICDGCVSAAQSGLTPGRGGAATAPAGDGPGTVTFAALGPEANGSSCDFCGKPRHRVAGIAASGDHRICRECVSLCQEIFADESG